MKEVVGYLDAEDLEQYTILDTDMRVMESGAVQMDYLQASEIVNRHREFFRLLHEKYELDRSDWYQVDTIDGAICVEKDV